MNELYYFEDWGAFKISITIKYSRKISTQEAKERAIELIKETKPTYR